MHFINRGEWVHSDPLVVTSLPSSCLEIPSELHQSTLVWSWVTPELWNQPSSKSSRKFSCHTPLLVLNFPFSKLFCTQGCRVSTRGALGVHDFVVKSISVMDLESWQLHKFSAKFSSTSSSKPVKVTQGRILALEYFKAEFAPLEFLSPAIPGEHSLECSKEEALGALHSSFFSVGFPSCRCSGPLGQCLKCSWQWWWCPRSAGAGSSSSLPSLSCSLLACVL